MLKRRFSLYLAIFAGTLTVLFGFWQETRFLVLLLRTGVSMLIFAFLGYLFGMLLEKIFRRILAQYKAKGANLDVTSEADIVDTVASPAPTFTPLSPENLEQIARPYN